MNDLELFRDFPDHSPETTEGRCAAQMNLDAEIIRSFQGRSRTWRQRASRPATWAVAAAAAVAAMVTTAALPRGGAAAPGRTSAGAAILSDAVTKFPNDTATDIVTYADQVVVVTAVSETEIPDYGPPQRAAAGEGTVARRITFRIEETLWQRPGASAGPSTFSSVWWGWVLHDGERLKFVAHGAPWIEVGSQYVMPVAYDEGAFAPLQPFAVFLYRDSRIFLSEGQDTELARELSGATKPVAAALFAKARIDERVAGLMKLSPSRRLDAATP